MNTEQILLSLTDLRHNLRQARFSSVLPMAILKKLWFVALGIVASVCGGR